MHGEAFLEIGEGSACALQVALALEETLSWYLCASVVCLQTCSTILGCSSMCTEFDHCLLSREDAAHSGNVTTFCHDWVDWLVQHKGVNRFDILIQHNSNKTAKKNEGLVSYHIIEETQISIGKAANCGHILPTCSVSLPVPTCFLGVLVSYSQIH